MPEVMEEELQSLENRKEIIIIIIIEIENTLDNLDENLQNQVLDSIV